MNHKDYINLDLIKDPHYEGGYIVTHLHSEGYAMIGRTDTLEGLKELIDNQNQRIKNIINNES